MAEGTVFTANLVSVTFGKSKKKKTPCIASRWHIEEEDIERTVYTYFTANNKKISFEKLEAVGFNGDFSDPQFSVETTKLRLIVSDYDDPETGETKESENWDFASWGGGVGLDDPDRKDIKQLNAEWKKNASAGDTAKKKAKKAKKEEPQKEEIPESEETEGKDDPDFAKDGEDEEPMTPYEAAWDAFLEHKATEKARKGLERNKRQTAIMEWSKILAEAIPDKDETKFDDEDWENVRAYCALPM
jgi:hypothetical protein